MPRFSDVVSGVLTSGQNVGTGAVVSFDATPLANRVLVMIINRGSGDIQVAMRAAGTAAPATGDFGAGVGDLVVPANDFRSIPATGAIQFHALSASGTNDISFIQFSNQP